ncbi:MAG: HD domain-containing protein [Candidatus Hydrogenedentes bacterium]|nr:HD domain-containing protein [Candidatus Hydrogenedentota bacterium]
MLAPGFDGLAYFAVMGAFEDRVVRLFADIHPLDRVARAGYVLRGVTDPESVAAHSHFVAVLALLFVDEYPALFDRERTLTMALLHDLPEAMLMDIPMPVCDGEFGDAKRSVEHAIFERMLRDFPARYGEYHRDLCDPQSPEAKLVRALDKAQMMLKISMYEKEGRGRLKEFWANPKNFTDYGCKPVSDLFDAICANAGRPRPR